jgi:heme-degrading monooxygenase HmoA
VVARVTTFRGSPDQIAEGVRIYSEAVGPWLRDATGFRGFVALGDPENERGIMISLWASEELARDSERSGMRLRDEVAETVQTPIERVEFLEVLLLDVPGDPGSRPPA